MLNRRTTLAALAALSCLGGAALAGGEPIATVRVADSLIHPVYATHAPGDFKRLYFIEKRGVIRILNLKTGLINAQPFLDINALVVGGNDTQDERGLLGLAFHPDFRKNGLFYVNYTGSSGTTNIARYATVTPDLADENSRQTVLLIGQPFSNHNGGWMDFGPNDGLLYIGTGDGGAANDPGRRGQDITNNLLGKIVRIDVDGEPPYGIPPDNPFVGVEGDDEIWSFGLRNPWRCSFDRENGDLYIADVGQNAWEEIDYQAADNPGGDNYGWRCREGAHPFIPGDQECQDATFVEPIQEYPHTCSTGGFSITGGYVYRGCAIPSLRGTYFYADYVCGNFWSFRYDGEKLTDFQSRNDELRISIGGHRANQVSSFGEDADGEMYIVDQGSGSDGQIFRIVPAKATISEADLNCDGIVGFGDLLQLLAEWGPCDGCEADFDGDCDVDFDDLLFLLARWG